MYKKIFFSLFVLIFISQVCTFAQFEYFCNQKCEKYNNIQNSVTSYKEFLDKFEYNRATVYNALNLSDCQIKAWEEIVNKNMPLYENKFKILLKENYRLNALKCSKSSEYEIYKQKRVINNIKKEISGIFSKENKEFKKILNSQQRAKYSMIVKLEKDDYKKASHKKDYYKSNSGLKSFGNPIQSNCSK